MKQALIMQSFAPLFLILFIKYYDFSLVSLCFKFFSLIFRNPCLAFVKAINNKMLIKLILEIFCFIWIVYCLYGVHRFKNSQRADFVSEGESLVDIQKLSDSGVTFFMTYVLPMTMDNLDTYRGMVIFCVLMAILFFLMWKTNLYYQNPVLTVLGYEVFSFKFETTQETKYRDKQCIGITRGKVNENQTIKRKKISDNVFLIYLEL